MDRPKALSGIYGLIKQNTQTILETYFGSPEDIEDTKTNKADKASTTSKTYTKSMKIFKQGWVFKKSKHLKKYYKHFMQLKGTQLLCYKSDKFHETNESPTETFDLSLHQYRIDKHETVKQKFYLIDEINLKSRTFKAPTQIERESWVFQIRNVLSHVRVHTDNTIHNQRLPGFFSVLTDTVESVMAGKKQQEMHDSESEQSDDDFDTYKVKKDSLKPTVQLRKVSSLSVRKMNYKISKKSFESFKMRTLTVDQLTINDMLDMEIVKEEKEDFDDDDDDDDDESLYDSDDMQNIDELHDMVMGNKCLSFFPDVNDGDNAHVSDVRLSTVDGDGGYIQEHIMEELHALGYEISDIITAMKGVSDVLDINEIQDKLDETVGIISKEIVDHKEPECVFDAKAAKRIRMRKYVENEIISSEETYYKGLKMLLNELIEVMFDKEYIDKKYYHQIRSSLPKILDFHSNFFNKLKAIYRETETVSAFIYNYITEHKQVFLDIYMEFIKDYNTILELFGTTFYGNEELNTFLKEKRTERKALSAFLILPIQRVPRYILLLTDLLKHTEETSVDYKDIKDSVEIFKNITSEINERKRKIENVSQCLQIQEALNGLKQPIVNDVRMFIEQFILIKKQIKHQRILFLFSDIVIITNEKWMVKHILDIRTLDVKNIVCNSRKALPEFNLISAGAGSVAYIAQDTKTVNRIKKLIGKWRVKLLSEDILESNETLGNLRTEIERQELMFD